MRLQIPLHNSNVGPDPTGSASDDCFYTYFILGGQVRTGPGALCLEYRLCFFPPVSISS
jgi:hypothetical protein